MAMNWFSGLFSPNQAASESTDGLVEGNSWSYGNGKAALATTQVPAGQPVEFVNQDNNQWEVDLGEMGAPGPQRAQLGIESVVVDEGVEIRSVNSGRVDVWNRQPGNKIVKEDDIVIVANGISGEADSNRFLEELSDAQSLKLIVRRPVASLKLALKKVNDSSRLTPTQTQTDFRKEIVPSQPPNAQTEQPWLPSVPVQSSSPSQLPVPPQPYASPQPVPGDQPPIPVATAPDFSGDWVLQQTDNMDAFLADIGVGDESRSYAKSKRYGEKVCRQLIRVDGESYRVISVGLNETMDVTYRVGQPVEMKAGDGSSVTQKTYWDGHILVVEAVHSDGQSLPTMRRSVDGTEMVLRMKTANGVESTQRLARPDKGDTGVINVSHSLIKSGDSNVASL